MTVRPPAFVLRGTLRPHTAGVLLLVLVLGACATAPPPAPPVVSFEQKMSWILRLEDERSLRDPAPPPPPMPVPQKRRAAPAPAPPVPDLVPLLSDAEARVRRRAALAVGRVGLADGLKPLAGLLRSDSEAEVRQVAAFALGLLGKKEAIDALRLALHDRSALVQGRAAEALSFLGDTASAPAIAAMVTAALQSSGVGSLAPDDLDDTHAPDVEAFRLGVLALGRLKAYDALASALLDASGRSKVAWWPVVAAFQRMEDRRALGVLTAFARGDSRVGRGFAAKGLGALEDAAAIDVLSQLALDWRSDTPTAVSAVRALGQIADPRAAPAIVRLLQDRGVDPLLLIEAVTAAGHVKASAAMDRLLDLASSPAPPVRAAALRSVRAIDPQQFVQVLSTLDPDPHWSVRASLATTLGTLEPALALPRLTGMLKDRDLRVIPSVLTALRTLNAPRIDQILLEWLKHKDVVIRAAAATELGELKPAGADAALVEAWRASAGDAEYMARGAILLALSKYGRAAAEPTLREGLADKDYAVRVRAASLLAPMIPTDDTAAAIRPAPLRHPAEFYASPNLVAPSVSPHVYVDTVRGTIEIELAVLDAPITCATFVELAGKGFFNGLLIHRVVPNFVVQDGDPRGDGEGGPGFTIRDEFNERPYLRGTVGLARDWAETGGSQFFITHSPQPHLDARYTAFGRVVAGMDVVDALQPWDAITSVRVWDGTEWIGQGPEP